MTAPDIITTFDEDGNECEYLFVDSFEVGDKTHAVLEYLCFEDGTPIPEGLAGSIIRRVELDANNEEWFAELDDDEREAAEAEWARICEQDDEEATLV